MFIQTFLGSLAVCGAIFFGLMALGSLANSSKAVREEKDSESTAALVVMGLFAVLTSLCIATAVKLLG